MCRLFALRSARPARADGPLVSDSASLLRQSGGDRRGQCHTNGWGIAWYEAGQSRRVRAPTAAAQDPRYRATAEAVQAPTVLGHVRQASVGDVVERNTHPFLHGPWLFAHNGTLQGFAADRDRLRRLIPPGLRRCVEGDTDSEHLFYYLLGALGTAATTRADDVARAVGAALCAAAEQFPGTAAAPSQLNVILTDGATLLATRWGHTLFWRHDAGAADAGGTIAVASEPTTEDGRWEEVPDRALLLIRPDLTHALAPLSGSAR